MITTDRSLEALSRVLAEQRGRMTEAPLIDDPLTRALARMRRVAPPEAPFAGWLARAGETVVQLVDAADLRGWPGWRSRGEHILSADDVARTPAGHQVVLRWCVERVDTFLARRAEGGSEMSAGELVTVAVSLIRGCHAARGEDLRGGWWLTQDGTPIFVCDVGGGADSIAESAAFLLDRLAEARVVDAAWRLRRVATMLREGEDVRDAEAHLFAIAPPEPLVLTPLTPRRAADLRRAGSVDVIEPERGHSLIGRLVRRHVDSDVGEMVSDAVDSVRRGAKHARQRIARPWLVAAGIAGVIVVGGLAWPTGSAPAANARPAASDTAGSEPVASEPVASESAPSEPEATATTGTGDPDVVSRAPQEAAVPESATPDAGSGAPADPRDPVGALQAALDAMVTCSDAACRAAFFEPSASTEMPAGAVDLTPAQRNIELLDDLGGVAILSVGGLDNTAAAQLVVLVQTDESWVIRDVRDVEAP